MGRFRTLTNQKETYTYNQYNERISGLERLKFARSIEGTDKKTRNFTLCGNHVKAFENHKTYIELHKAHAIVGPNCNKCADVPVTLHHGLQSEICYNEYFKTINELKDHPCKCINVHDIDYCKTKKGTLYEYGHFNNNTPDLTYNLHRKLYLCCNKRKPCPVYVFCKCPPNTDNCKCCDYTVTFPFKDKFLHYTVSGCNNPDAYNEANNPLNNPGKTYSKYVSQKTANEIIKDISEIDFAKHEGSC